MVIVANVGFCKKSKVRLKDGVCYEMSDYLEMIVTLEQDTICMGDELLVKVAFKNKADSVQWFYPRTDMIMFRHYKVFDSSDHANIVFVDLQIDVENCKSIEPYGVYEDTHVVKVTESFFWRGMNCDIHFRYKCNLGVRTIRNGKESCYDGLYEGKHRGVLYSNETCVYVK